MFHAPSQASSHSCGQLHNHIVSLNFDAVREQFKLCVESEYPHQLYAPLAVAVDTDNADMLSLLLELSMCFAQRQHELGCHCALPTDTYGMPPLDALVQHAVARRV